jgi:O-antigen/teichoic acid export membrane protein
MPEGLLAPVCWALQQPLRRPWAIVAFASPTLRTRRSILTYSAGIVFTAVTMVTAMVTRPMLLQPTWLGKDGFGAFRMITGWYGYLTLLDLGLGAALSPLLARALGQGDTRVLRGTLGAGIRTYLKLTLLAIFVGLTMLPLIIWQVPVPPGRVNDLGLAWIICLLSLLPMGLAPLRTLAEARQRGYWVNSLMTVQCVLITALSLLLAWAGWGIAGQAWAFSLGIMTFFAMLVWGELRDNPHLLSAAWSAPADPEIVRAIRSLSLPSLLIILSGRVGLLSDNIVAGGFLGTAMVASLDSTVQLASLAQGQLQAIGASSWAALAGLHAQGDLNTFNRRLLELTKVVALLGLAVLGPVAAYNRQFFNLWLGPKLVAYAGSAVIVIAAVNAFLLGLFSLWGWCFAGTGQIRRLLTPTVTATVVNLAASLILTHQVGLVGPALGTLVANLTVTLWWLPILICRSFGISLRALFRAVAWPLVWGVPYAAGLWWVAHSHHVWGWFGLAAEAGGAAVLFLLLGGLVILTPAERALWRVRLANFFPHRGGSPDTRVT